MTDLRLGTATADITPTWPLTLAGFAARTEPAQGVSRPLQVHVSVLETSHDGSPPRRAVVVVADLLWWAAEDVDSLRQAIATESGTTPDMVLLSATHTHSGPQTSHRASREIGAADPRFTTLLREQVLTAATAAVAKLEPVTIERFVGSCDLGFNRRAERNHPGPVDATLTVIRFERANGSPATLWVHFTCHPVITQEPLISSEFCGVAMTQVTDRVGAPAIYLQGCCGDINPVVPGEARSWRGTDREVVQAGTMLAEAVTGLLATGTPEPIAPIPLAAHALAVDLPFDSVPSVELLRERTSHCGLDGEVAQALLAHPEWCNSTIPLMLQRLDIAAGCSLLAINGEVVVEYGLRIREWSGGSVLPLGYANGMTGYIPTARIIAEGGYEAGDAAPYFFLPGPFSPHVESLLDDAIITILAR